MTKKRNNPYSSQRQWNRDPRKWKTPKKNTIARYRRFELKDFSAIYIGAGFILVGFLVYFILFRPLVLRKLDEGRFKECRERLMDVKAAIEKTREDKPAYVVSDIYKGMNKHTNIHVEEYVNQACDGKNGKTWSMSENINIPTANDYYVYGLARSHPPCLITVRPEVIWPMSLDTCGQPPPGGGG